MKIWKNRKLQLILTLSLSFLGAFFIQEQTAMAATPVTIKTVDYEEENIIVNNNGNTRIYFATNDEAAKDNWEVLDADSGTATTIDISWLSASIDNVLSLKGEENETKVSVTIIERTQKFNISINYLGLGQLDPADNIASLLNIMTTAGSGSNPIVFDNLEWKKGDSGKWKDSSELTVAQLSKYQIKGTELYFRIKAINDVTVGTLTPDGTMGNRASSDTKLRITKKVTAMVVGIDGAEFFAEIKYGKEYRITTTGGTTDWVAVTDKAVKRVPLETIYPGVSDGTTATKAFPAGIIEIRNYTTSKAASSKITEIDLNAQRTIPSVIKETAVPVGATSSDKNIYIDYNGTKSMVITIPNASVNNPYEYCIIKLGDTFDIERVAWSSITKNTDVKILNSKAVESGTIYVRMKEIKSVQATKISPAVAYELASTYVTYKINYPSDPYIESILYEYIKGYSDPFIFNIQLNVVGKKAFEAQIKNIKVGTKEISFTSTITPVILTGADTSTTEHIMKVTIEKASLDAMANISNKGVTITFMNGTTNKTSVKLTVRNPIPAAVLTATAVKGSAVGTTVVSVVTSAATGNKIVYSIGATEVVDKMIEDTISGGITQNNLTDIAVTPGQYVTVYEVNIDTNKIVRYKSLLISADKIN